MYLKHTPVSSYFHFKIFFDLNRIYFSTGVNPYNIRGSNCGIFVGVVCSEAFQAWTKDPDNTAGYTITGCALAMFANRLSYHFDFTGKKNAYGMEPMTYIGLSIRTKPVLELLMANRSLSIT